VNSATRLPKYFERNKIVKLTIKLALLTFTFLLGSVVALAQDSLMGKYEGIVKTPDAREIKVTLELKNEGGKLSGQVMHDNKTTDVIDGKLDNGTLTLNFSGDRKMILKVDGDKLVGEAIDSKEKVSIDLKKVTPAAAAAAAPVAAPAAAPAAVNLNGNWDAVADANGNPVPFTLALKVDGEAVTGSSSSQVGEGTIKSGSWKAGKLVLDIETPGGVISMSATVIDGKLSGEFDYAGQVQGKWVAVKKN
jgi:hypothetical protein